MLLPHSRTPRSRRGPRLAFSVALLVASAIAPTASAEPDLLAPSTKPMFATFGLGPSIGLNYSGTQFRLAEDFGYHFSGKGDGPALGAEVSEAFGEGFFRFQAGGKFWWDIQPVSTLGLYVAPTAQFGFAHVSAGGASDSAFDMQYGLEGRLVLADRAMLFFRPVGIDVVIGGNATGNDAAVIYDLAFGGGVIF